MSGELEVLVFHLLRWCICTAYKLCVSWCCALQSLSSAEALRKDKSLSRDCRPSVSGCVPVETGCWLNILRAIPGGNKKKRHETNVQLLFRHKTVFSVSHLHLFFIHFHTEVTFCSWPATEVHQRRVLSTGKRPLTGIKVCLQSRRGKVPTDILTPLLSIDCKTPTSELMEDSPGDICLYSSTVARVSSRLTSTSNTIPFSSAAHSDAVTADWQQGKLTGTYCLISAIKATNKANWALTYHLDYLLFPCSCGCSSCEIQTHPE